MSSCRETSMLTSTWPTRQGFFFLLRKQSGRMPASFLVSWLLWRPAGVWHLLLPSRWRHSKVCDLFLRSDRVWLFNYVLPSCHIPGLPRSPPLTQCCLLNPAVILIIYMLIILIAEAGYRLDFLHLIHPGNEYSKYGTEIWYKSRQWYHNTV